MEEKDKINASTSEIDESFLLSNESASYRRYYNQMIGSLIQDEIIESSRSFSQNKIVIFSWQLLTPEQPAMCPGFDDETCECHVASVAS